MSRWFRLYDALLDDPKVQRLPAEDFKGWVNLLCLASRNEGKLPPIADIAFALRLDESAVSTLLERLLNGGLIEARNGGANGKHYAPYKWEERQYKSDTSTDRVKRFRQRSETVTETPPETEAETEKEPPLAPRKRGDGAGMCFPKDWQLPPTSSLTPKARACAEQWTQASYETEGEGFILYWRQSRKRRPDWHGTWCAWVIRQHSKVMRDQKFGNAPTETAKANPAQLAQNKRGLAEIMDMQGRRDEANALRIEAARIEQRAA